MHHVLQCIFSLLRQTFEMDKKRKHLPGGGGGRTPGGGAGCGGGGGPVG